MSNASNAKTLEGLIRQAMALEVAEGRHFWRVYDGLDSEGFEDTKETMLDIKFDEEKHLTCLLDIAKDLEMDVGVVALHRDASEHSMSEEKIPLDEALDSLSKTNRRMVGFYDKLLDVLEEASIDGVETNEVRERLERTGERVLDHERKHSAALESLLEGDVRENTRLI